MFAFSRPQSALRDAITTAYRRDEAEAVADMLARAQLSEDERREAEALARRLVKQVRDSRRKASGVDALMHEFSLSSEECGYAQQADSGQDCRRRLEKPLGAQPVHVCERLRLGIAHHRQAHRRQR